MLYIKSLHGDKCEWVTAKLKSCVRCFAPLVGEDGTKTVFEARCAGTGRTKIG